MIIFWILFKKITNFRNLFRKSNLFHMNHRGKIALLLLQNTHNLELKIFILIKLGRNTTID